MKFILKLEDAQLDVLRSILGGVDALGNGVYRLRIAVDGDELKFKANERMWTPPLGRAVMEA